MVSEMKALIICGIDEAHCMGCDCDTQMRKCHLYKYTKRNQYENFGHSGLA